MESKLFETRKNQKIAILTVALLSVIFLTIFSVRAENTVTYVSLPVKLVQQAYSNWCWAAGSESILYYCKNYLGFGEEATQWDIVKYIYGSYVNKPASLYDIQRALELLWCWFFTHDTSKWLDNFIWANCRANCKL